MLGRLARAALDALFGAAAEALREWRRDRALGRLGYTEAQLEERRAAARARRQADAIDAKPDPDHIDGTLGRL